MGLEYKANSKSCLICLVDAASHPGGRHLDTLGHLTFDLYLLWYMPETPWKLFCGPNTEPYLDFSVGCHSLAWEPEQPFHLSDANVLICKMGIIKCAQQSCCEDYIR